MGMIWIWVAVVLVAVLGGMALIDRGRRRAGRGPLDPFQANREIGKSRGRPETYLGGSENPLG
jgi:hypothetical protein